MVCYWPDVNIEAPIVRAFLEHNLKLSGEFVITIGFSCGADECDGW